MRVVKELKEIQRCVDILEGNGYEVSLYYEYDYIWSEMRSTTVVINDPNVCVDYYGYAMCAPEDKFSRKVGTELAFRRAMADMSANVGRARMKMLFG